MGRSDPTATPFNANKIGRAANNPRLFQHLKLNKLVLFEICNIRDPETSSTTVPNKIYLKESWIASLSLAMTILKIRNVIAKECICTTVAIHFCYLILFYFIVLLYVYIDYRIYSGQ